ncbi:hypothetical protein EDD18DRAFT_1098846 [Armillaria luteobubalina]|uniref:Uncharacterized protein n=1 Tax=Armillaria luteobubalina TaxID=153913 RepID=A0AA39QM65_9AGAR|nr:hypothetical protein EDD18DRAFT_1098846 [Armillaria luteobubalina]
MAMVCPVIGPQSNVFLTKQQTNPQVYTSHTYSPPFDNCTPRITIAREHSVSPPPVNRGSPPLSEASDTSDDSMHSDDDNISGGALDEEDVDDEVKVIPKPPGEPGCPKSSGYNLEQALSWPDAIYQQNHVHREAHRRLETRKSFKNQKVEEIQAICDAAVNDHSILRVYENAWPVHDMLKLRLKYTSEKARHQRGKRMQQKLTWKAGGISRDVTHLCGIDISSMLMAGERQIFFKSYCDNNEIQEHTRLGMAMPKRPLRSFQLQDLLRNVGDRKNVENLSVNNGCVGTYIKEQNIFITTPNSSFIPHPPTTMEIVLCEDGHFGHHDPTRTPQFFDEKFCHFPIIPHCPGPNDDTHPYCNWLDTICMPSATLTSVLLLLVVQNGIQKSLTSSWASVAAMQSYWLELVAGLDYMEHYQPVMNGQAQHDNSSDFSYLMGTFTINLDVAEQHIRAGIPVYLVRRIDQFSNQVILEAEMPVDPLLNTSLPSPPFPVVFKGDPSHPQKFHAMHCFMHIFHTFQNPFNFATVSQLAVVQAESAPVASSSSASIPSSLPTSNQQWDKFMNLAGTYAPSPIPAWANANAKIDKMSKRSQEHKERDRLAQRQHDNEGGGTSYEKGYVFPDPGLLVYASAIRQNSFFHQWDYCRDALIYRITSSSSNAKPLQPQLWHELLAMSFKSKNAKSTRVHDLMAHALGSALEAPSSNTTTPQTLTLDIDQPVDIERGRYLIWELCELNFRHELLLLDTHLTHPDLLTKGEDTINFRLGCQEQIMGLFSDGSLVPSTSTSTNRLALGTWPEQFEALKLFRDVISLLRVSLNAFFPQMLISPATIMAIDGLPRIQLKFIFIYINV